MSKECTKEASAVHTKQVNYERKIADLCLTISRLETTLREAEKRNLPAVSDSEPQSLDNGEVKRLSEKVFQMGDKIANHNSEIKTFKSRLRAANERAEKAEEELASLTMARENSAYDIERAGSATLGRRRKPGGLPNSSIRTAMNLNGVQGERTEQIGKVVDVVDSFAVSTGETRPSSRRWISSLVF